MAASLHSFITIAAICLAYDRIAFLSEIRSAVLWEKKVRHKTDITKPKIKKENLYQDSNTIPAHLEIKSEWENIALSTVPLFLVGKCIASFA